jgi:hypothetical protein
MGAINEIDIAKLVLLPAVLYVAKRSSTGREK